MPTHIFTAFFEDLDGSTLAGPVTVDKDEYLFVNKYSAADVYFNLKKSADGWYLSGGPTTHQVPPPFIEEIGRQIDEFHEKNKPQ